ncbi:hypothetical protein GG804_24985 [Sphingomonas histidinilytica]|uniref:hypothetical protein n=1 Tax=Rhizorhabdus histidinilytica TaxID=439228 RepID=UPI001ADC3452|nr:hypothetical protein [Rhizorhabdus histidinilytica]MBO9380027.1 hypothetical protein [Rhizorhabdus histidinilytica]
MTTTARAGSVFLADNRRNLWSVDVHPDTNVEDIERPGFWAHEASKLRQFDRIEIRWEDGQKWADAIVLANGAGFARVAIINLIDAAVPADGEQQQADADFTFQLVDVKWKGPTSKWCIIRKSDGHLVKDGIGDKIIAMTEAAQYEKTVRG